MKPRLLVAVLLSATLHAATPQQPFPQYTIIEGKLDNNSLPIGPAKLCIHDTATCFSMPSDPNGKTGALEFGLEPKAERVNLPNGGSWILFSAEFSAGGSGTARKLALLSYSQNTLNNLLPHLRITNLGEYAIWYSTPASRYPVLVTADYIWAKGETHYSSHRYQMQAWIFDETTQAYRSRVSYKTTKFYGEEQLDKTTVLAAERSRMTRALQNLK